MTEIRKYNTRAAQVSAMRILIGTTSRPEIIAFAPEANVGVLSTDMTQTDIRWVQVPGEGNSQEMRNDGDWLVKTERGYYLILSDREFNERYVAL